MLVRAKFKYKRALRVEEKREMRIRYTMEMLKKENTKNEFQREMKLQFCLKWEYGRKLEKVEGDIWGTSFKGGKAKTKAGDVDRGKPEWIWLTIGNAENLQTFCRNKKRVYWATVAKFRDKTILKNKRRNSTKE